MAVAKYVSSLWPPSGRKTILSGIRWSLLSWCLTAVSGTSALATTYYVSPEGNDAHRGTLWVRPLLTIQRAHDLALPGDTILVMKGEYVNYEHSYNTMITKSGTPEKWIVYKNYPGHTPVIRVYKEYGFYLKQVSYISIEGFEFKGPKLPRDSIAQGRQIGLFIEGEPRKPSTHIRLYNNNFSYCPTAGLLISYFDYVKIEHNQFFGNAAQRNAYGALVLMHGVMSDQHNAARNIINGNALERNGFLPHPGEEKNIQEYQRSAIKIIDIKGRDVTELASTLVTNNVLATNGCGGIFIANSSGIGVINNTLYRNNEDDACAIGEIKINQSTSIQVYNNIFSSSSSKPGSHSTGICQIDYRHNLYYNFAYHDPGENDIVANPQFDNAGTKQGVARFRLLGNSPAINSGIDSLLPMIDFEGNTRKHGPQADLGALEFTSTPTQSSAKNNKVPFAHIKSVQANWLAHFNKDAKTYTLWNYHTRGFTLKMINSKGETVYQHISDDRGYHVQEIDLRHFSPGIYEITAFNSQENFREKIVLD